VLLSKTPRAYGRAYWLALLLSVAMCARAGAQETEVTACGQLVVGDAYLSSSLDCPGFAAAVILEQGGRLRLNGFEIGGAVIGVDCFDYDRRCVIEGPGLIRDNERFGVKAARLDIRNVTLTGNASSTCSPTEGWCFGALWASGKARVRDCTVTDNGGVGLQADGSGVFGDARLGKVVIKNSVVARNGNNGVHGDTIKTLRVVDSEISGNALDGISGAFFITLKHSRLNNNGGDGVRGFRLVRLRGSELIGNALSGTRVTWCGAGRTRVRLVDSIAASSGSSSRCGVDLACADLGACETPKLKGTSSCETSYMSESGIPGSSWGVCSLDAP